MKKGFKFLVLALVSFVLIACGNGGATKNSSADSQLQARLIVTIDTNKLDEKISFTKGDTVMDVLKANYDVEETSGFITSIDGQEQNEKESIYWMFKINGELAPKAADQIEVSENDEIEFYQEKFN